MDPVESPKASNLTEVAASPETESVAEAPTGDTYGSRAEPEEATENAGMITGNNFEAVEAVEPVELADPVISIEPVENVEPFVAAETVVAAEPLDPAEPLEPAESFETTEPFESAELDTETSTISMSAATEQELYTSDTTKSLTR